MVMESIESKGKTLICGKNKEVMKETICFKPRIFFGCGIKKVEFIYPGV